MKLTVEDASFFMQQLHLIGTGNPDGSARFVPISWLSYTWGPPRCLVVSMFGSKQTKENIARTGLLSAAVVTRDLLPLADRFGGDRKSPELVAEMEGLAVPGKVLKVPVLWDAKFSYECQVLRTVKLGKTHTYFAEIKGVSARNPEVVEAGDYLDALKLDPVVYTDFHYFALGEDLGPMGAYQSFKAAAD